MGNPLIAHSFGASTVCPHLNQRSRYASSCERKLLQLVYRSLPSEATVLQSDAGLTFDESCNFYVRVEFFSISLQRCCIFAPDTQRPCRA